MSGVGTLAAVAFLLLLALLSMEHYSSGTNFEYMKTVYRLQTSFFILALYENKSSIPQH